MVWCTARLLLIPFWLQLITCVTHTQGRRILSSEDIPVTAFSCTGRPTGYYADTETGCQVYHMCDEGGTQFSYRCPNTTLFQQRMLICAHWYQVNCSRSESDYVANLLIGQRDKPFVTDAEHKYFNYRKHLTSYGLQRTGPAAESGLDRTDSTENVSTTSTVTGNTSSLNKLEGVATRQLYERTTTNTDNIVQQASTEFIRFQKDALLTQFNFSTSTVSYNRPTSLDPEIADYVNVREETESNIPLQTTTDVPEIQDVNAFIDRFVPPASVYNNPYTANRHKQVAGKDVYTNDFQVKDTSLREPSLYLQPPEYNSGEDNNKIELVFDDPRRVFFIAENGTESVNAEPLLVTIRLNKSQMLFRNQHSCAKCHPLFVVNKDTCMPCVVVR